MSPTFDELLSAQIGSEFAASHQYVAVAAWFDDHDLPELARRFYRQALEERNHAMMFVQYRLDRELGVTIPGIPGVRNDFESARDAISLALEQELRVTAEIEALFAAARAESDALGEQFLLWFLNEQVEEVAAMRTLLAVAERAENLFDLENFMARESGNSNRGTLAAPPTADGGI